jgi:DNA-binding transcriptional LysR family regulator
MSPDLLRGISAFVEVAKLKSVSLAAVALDLPKSTVSRRVTSLERAKSACSWPMHLRLATG